MHGLGNDFMIVDNRFQNINFTSKLVKKLSDRHYGIGFDQLLIIEIEQDKNIDFLYRIFNSDGQEVEQCGNGARCFALFLLIKKIIDRKSIRVRTIKRDLKISFLENDLIEVNMGEPVFKTKSVPCLQQYRQDNHYPIDFYGKQLYISVVSIGNPHCVLFLNDLKDVDVVNIGEFFQSHKIFPEQVNVSFVEVLNNKEIFIRVYERGIRKETNSCGSAACAVVAVGVQKKILSNTVVKVNLLGGVLFIKWRGIGESMYMVGPANHVYDGVIKI